MSKSWRSYEEVATYLLDKFSSEFGLSFVEGKQKIKGQRSQTGWEIDAKGCRASEDGFIIIECKRYTTSKQNQEKVAGLAYKIIDTGAKGGILVSPLGFQSGAKIVANSENIIEVHLNENSTASEFSMRFLNKVMAGLHEYITATDSVKVTKSRACEKCGKHFVFKNNEKICPECL
jgi:hypothetical protein